MVTTIIHRPLLPAIARELRWEQLRQEFLAKYGLPLIAGAAAGAWTFTNGGRTRLLNGTFALATDTLKMALFLSTSNIGAASTTFAGVTNEHAAANGYTAGGVSVTGVLAGTTTVTFSGSANATWTASGGSIVARFAVLYEVAGDVICYWTRPGGRNSDHGEPVDHQHFHQHLHSGLEVAWPGLAEHFPRTTR